jgi:hypothetical protein
MKQCSKGNEISTCKNLSSNDFFTDSGRLENTPYLLLLQHQLKIVNHQPLKFETSTFKDSL